MTPNPLHQNKLNIILPIAPNANHRKVGDENNLPQAMLPVEAVNWLKALRQGGRDVGSIDLCGPGDVLTSWDATKTCLDLLVEELAPVSLTCLGFSGVECGTKLLQYDVKKITVLVDTINHVTAMGMYQWLRPGKKNIPLAQGAELLIAEQESTIKFMVDSGLEVVVRTEVIVGVNDSEIVAIAEKMASFGVKNMELIGGEQVVGELKPYLSAQVVSVEPPMPPPGTPGACTSEDMPKPTKEHPYVAVASSDGMDVNLHLGQAEKILIYGAREDGLPCLIETRDVARDGGVNRWQDLANLLSDCFVFLASHAGKAPREQLATAGINVLLVEDQIEGLVDVLFGGGKKGKCKK